MQIRSQFNQAIKDGNVEEIKHLLKTSEFLSRRRPPFAGGSWLHYAAVHGTLDSVKCLIDLGFDVNDKATLEGDRPITRAARRDTPDFVTLLLDHGAVLDTQTSVRNPLFSAIHAGCFDVAQVLLDAGIDTTVRYTAGSMTDMDATAFALRWGRTDMAELIAQKAAEQSGRTAEAVLERAREVVRAEGPLQPVQLVPEDAAEHESGDGPENE